MLRVRHGVADDILQKDLQHAASLLVDEAGDTLDTTTTGETPNSLSIRRVRFLRHNALSWTWITYRFGNTLNVVAKNLAVTLSTTLSKTLNNGQG